MEQIKTLKTTARTAGIFYLLQIPLGVFGIMYIPKVLVSSENISQTITNILNNEFLFRLSIVSAILCALITIVTAVYICKLLKPVNRVYAKTIVVFTLIVAPITMLNELNHVAILVLLKNPEYVASFSMEQKHAIISLFLELHTYGIQIVGIFFGLWLLPMGYLVIKSQYIPKIIGIMLLVTCGGYLFDFVTFFLCPNWDIVISEYTWLGEVLMVLWLLLKGVNAKAFQKHYGTALKH